MRIFLVEDHKDTREALRRYLEREGHEVACAATATEALEKFPASNCEVLISDIGMPKLDGWAMLENLHLQGSPPPFAIALSGFTKPSDIARSVEAGYRCHIKKPFDPDQIRAVLGFFESHNSERF